MLRDLRYGSTITRSETFGELEKSEETRKIRYDFPQRRRGQWRTRGWDQKGNGWVHRITQKKWLVRKLEVNSRLFWRPIRKLDAFRNAIDNADECEIAIPLVSAYTTREHRHISGISEHFNLRRFSPRLPPFYPSYLLFQHHSHWTKSEQKGKLPIGQDKPDCKPLQNGG